jgi:RNA recognition motif-containing protein
MFEMHEVKIFVGNIPFDATPKEFNECFKNTSGFVSADLMLTRGFGFVTYKNKSFCDSLIRENNSFIRNRKLRLSLYDQPKKTIQEKIYIRLENINEYITRDEIKKEFDNFCKTGLCFIDRNRETGEFLDTGLIELFDKDVSQQLLNLGSIVMPDSSEIILKPYEDKTDVQSKPRNIIKAHLQ